MAYATREDKTLRATAPDSAYYVLRDLRDPVAFFLDFGCGSIPTDLSYFSGRAAGSQIASRCSNPYERDPVLTVHLLLFATATFLLGMPVVVVLSGGVKQITTPP